MREVQRQKENKTRRKVHLFIVIFTVVAQPIHIYAHFGFWPFKSNTHCIRAKCLAELNGRIVQKIETKGSTDKKIHVKTAMDDTTTTKKKHLKTEYTQNKASRERKQTKHFVSWLEQRAHISCKLSFAIFTVARERVRVLLFASRALTWIRCIGWLGKNGIAMHNMIILRIQQQSA